jgi:hypothetical protein
VGVTYILQDIKWPQCRVDLDSTPHYAKKKGGGECKQVTTVKLWIVVFDLRHIVWHVSTSVSQNTMLDPLHEDGSNRFLRNICNHVLDYTIP